MTLQKKLEDAKELLASLKKQYKEEKQFIWRMQLQFSMMNVKSEIKVLERAIKLEENGK